MLWKKSAKTASDGKADGRCRDQGHDEHQPSDPGQDPEGGQKEHDPEQQRQRRMLERLFVRALLRASGPPISPDAADEQKQGKRKKQDGQYSFIGSHDRGLLSIIDKNHSKEYPIFII